MSTASTDRQMEWRQLKDRLARYMVAVGGIGVIMAIILIFVYLLYIVMPLFSSASVEKVADYPLPASGGKTLYLAMEEQAEIAIRVTDQGQVQFLQTTTGKPVKTVQLPLPENSSITSFAEGSFESSVLAVGLSNGQAIIFKHHFKISFPNDKRVLTPVVEYPLGEEPLLLDWGKHPLQTLAVQVDEESATLVAVTDDQRLMMTSMSKEESMMDDEVSWGESETMVIAQTHKNISFILLDKNQRNLYIANAAGELSFYDVSDKTEPSLVQHLSLLKGHNQLRSLQLLTGDISLLAGDAKGNVTQWFPVKDEEGRRVLRRIRGFSDLNHPVTVVAPEYNRKGFLAVDESGVAGLFHTTAENTLVLQRISDSAILNAAIAPRANAMLLQDAQRLYFYSIDNEYPEVSMKALWGKVWYESYPKPDYVWQSSSASNDFEPKLSLIPISYGTIKAAFYAMLFAIPLAVMGAIFTAQFMSPSMRKVVKPSIEIMEALPTVILGFLAGLWLAPFMEANLPGVFSILVILPMGLLLFAYLWPIYGNSFLIVYVTACRMAGKPPY
ncbi:Phosphate transport system permease protein PstC (TC 3.A.1.7.1) [hydrothermal vent metagenome]|uniref:Phosphate transport system permease protein PstC (TC 3.A.1.7.1) n=1 Tax=hydrothermal vent metagenome TaxID=652676 RepID=A0A3B1BH88_9ZZZZ